MAVINLTPHSIQVYAESQFVNLEQKNPTTWVADGVQGQPLAEFESQGCLRITTNTVPTDSVDAIPMVATEYGELTGVPKAVSEEDRLIVSLPAQSMAKSARFPLASQMVAPYRVVRSRENGSIVLGCMGFTY